jgi:putative membrane protein
MLHRQKVLLLMGAAVLLAHTARAQSLSAQDRQFMTESAKGGMTEVRVAQMGLDRGKNPTVKSFSQRLVNDHTKGNQELMALAKMKNVQLPPEDPKVASSMPIAKKTGADFDKEFAKMMVDDHQKTIELFEKEASSGSDPDVKSWASKTLPTLRSHLTEAQALQTN